MKTLLLIILSFGKIGLISLGGGNAMLKLLEVESVDYYHWVSEEEFIKMVGTTFLFPGLTGVKLAALIGYKAGGLCGATLAVIALNLPGLILVAIGYQWLNNHSSPLARKIMVSVQYGALALLAAATFSFGQGVITIYHSLAMIVACALFFLALTVWDLSPFWGFVGFIGVCFFIVR